MTTDQAASHAPEAERFPPVDLATPQLTIRAVLTGMVLGGILSLCNIYSGLKIGWGFNMSVTAALLSYGFWQTLHATARTRRWELLESNINQTAASSAASISSSGLVAPIPALTMLTGQTLGWPALSVWVFSVSLVGVVVAIGLRRQMLLVDRLPFPSGIATGETVKEMYARGKEAMARVTALLSAGVVASAAKLTTHFAKIKPWGVPGSYAPSAGSALSGAGIEKVTLHNLGFAIDPSLLLFGVGAIIGIRAGVSLLLGSVLGWGVLAPHVLDMGWAEPGKAEPGVLWFGSINKWMLWPGVAMMVTASLTSFAFSWRSVLAALRGTRGSARSTPPTESTSSTSAHEVPRRWFIAGLLAALALASTTQVTLFGIEVWVAVVAVLATFVLAIVAGRVAGETGITPVGAMGKVTQLMFGAIAPGNATANLMAANITGGASSQCADMLHDLKTGLMLGASPRFQTVAQVFGVLAGSLAGSAAYLLLVPDPKAMLLTPEWPAPAVAAWKAVAQVLSVGLSAMPERTPLALGVAGGLGVLLAILEKRLPGRARAFVPSPSAIGLALVIPALYSISMFLGGFAALALGRVAKSWSARFTIVIASGLIAGESLAGVGLAIADAIQYLSGGG